MPLVRAVANKVVAAFLIVMGLVQIALAVGLLEQRHHSAEFTRCTAAWQAEFLSAYSARVHAGQRVSNAVDRIVQAVESQNRHASHLAIQHYLNVRDHQEKAWTAHPLPPLPAKQCGH